MKIALLVATVAFAAVTQPALAGDEPPGPAAAIEFQTPSGNIGCVFIPDGGTDTYTPADGRAELQCDRQEPTYMRVIFGSKGKPKKYANVGDVSCCGGDVLPYGELWTAGPFACTVKPNGLTCKRGKHGFVMSRSAIKTF
jgi:hypothetical protein